MKHKRISLFSRSFLHPVKTWEDLVELAEKKRGKNTKLSD